MSGVYLLLNDSDPAISYSGQWTEGPSDYGSSHRLEAGDDGWISVAFNGTSVVFAGSAPGAHSQVDIDGELEMFGHAPDPDENSHWQWYNLSELADGLHTVNLSRLANGTQLDYVLVEAGPSTSLANSSIVIGANRREIMYSEDWELSPDDESYSPPGGYTVASTADGATFTFEFIGTAVYVYGTQKSDEGTPEVIFTVDDHTPSFVAPNEGDIPNYLYFQKDDLKPSSHTLMCNVTQATSDQSFVLNYILYTPSFDLLADKPDYDPIQPQASASPSQNPKHHGHNHGHPGSGIPAGAIAGLVAGIVVFSAIVVTLTVIWWRGRREQRRVALSRTSSFGDATIASGVLSPPEYKEVRTPLVPNRFDPNLFVTHNERSEKYTSSRRQLSLASRFGIGWGYSKRTSSYPETF